MMREMRITLPELETPATLVLNRGRRLTEDEYWDFCAANPDLRIERNASGAIEILPAAGLQFGFRCAEMIAQLHSWADSDGRGHGCGSLAHFLLANGAARSPVAGWISREKIAGLSRADKQRFVPIVPEFAVEILAEADHLPDAQDKMCEWMRNGVQLGWLIDGDNQTAYVYRGSTFEKLTGLSHLKGEGPVVGFVADLTAIWAGL